MNGINHLFDIETKSDIALKKDKNKIIIKIRSSNFGGDTFYNVVSKLYKTIKEHNLEKNIVILKTDEIFFQDKTVYILLESVIYYICKNCKVNIKILNKSMQVKNIYLANLNSSLLASYANEIIDKNKYITDFEKTLISKEKYRKIVSCGDKKNPSIVLTDLTNFFKIYKINEEFKEELVDMLVELIGNANEHSKSDCLIDLTIDNKVINKVDSHRCIALDISILNFSKTLLGDGIKENFIKSNKFFLNLNPKTTYKENKFIQDLKYAYKNHSAKFDEKYTEEVFFNISTFQWRFSGRDEIVRENGGTGLTKVIEVLLNLSEAYKCYVYSGNKIIYFDKDFLKTIKVPERDKGFYVGFNESGDYLNHAPSKDIIGETPFHLNGTCYNFKFILPNKTRSEI